MSASSRISLQQYSPPPAFAAGLASLQIGYDDSAVITFVVAVSAIRLPGIGTALWGRVAGGIANLVFSRKADFL